MPSITGLKRGKETQHEVQCKQQYQPCHTTAAVLLDQTGHDAEHLGPDDARRENNTRYNVTSKTSTAHATDGTQEGVRGCQAPHPKGLTREAAEGGRTY